MKFSVLVCSYNSSQPNLTYTIDSILEQSLDDFEIIVCDDGSKNNHKDFLINYFNVKNFRNYKLIFNPFNQGTVKNIISGLNVARGKYIKPIGAGDKFSKNSVLEDIFSYMEKNKCSYLFTNMNIFSMKNGKKIMHSHLSIPLLKKKYINSSYNSKMRENIIVFNDQISGASLFYRKDKFEKKLNLIKDKVIYMEDLIQYLILLNDEPIHYFNEFCIDYEIGAGLSTLKNKDNNIRMKTDKDNFLNFLFDKYSENSYVKRRKKLEDIDKKVANKYIRGILKFLQEPKWIKFRIRRR